MRSEVHMRCRFSIGLVAALAAFPALAQAQTDLPAIRAGRNLASTVCFACHVVSANQPLEPVMGPGIPSFQEIANRSGVSAEWLIDRMTEARWHDSAFAATRLPMSNLSDAEKGQVAKFIPSLRNLE